jgi:hypothetical protein
MEELLCYCCKFVGGCLSNTMTIYGTRYVSELNCIDNRNNWFKLYEGEYCLKNHQFLKHNKGTLWLIDGRNVFCEWFEDKMNPNQYYKVYYPLGTQTEYYYGRIIYSNINSELKPQFIYYGDYRIYFRDSTFVCYKGGQNSFTTNGNVFRTDNDGYVGNYRISYIPLVYNLGYDYIKNDS